MDGNETSIDMQRYCRLFIEIVQKVIKESHSVLQGHAEIRWICRTPTRAWFRWESWPVLFETVPGIVGIGLGGHPF